LANSYCRAGGRNLKLPKFPMMPASAAAIHAHQRVRVPLGDRAYDIELATGGLSSLGQLVRTALPKVDRLGLVTSVSVDRLHGAHVESALRETGLPVAKIVLPDGEGTKSLAHLGEIFDVMLPAGLTRQSAIVAVGGGVVGDLAGYAAASIMRGIRLLQVPTTLLAMVDSSVGGKTGINHAAGKNLIGAFHQPSAVLIDSDFLATLPIEEFRAGFAEVIKYGVIRDAAFFAFLEENLDAIYRRDPLPLLRILERSVAIKAEVVAADEREESLRAILNYGHTVGHALEAATHYAGYRHGETVAIGMIAANRLAARLGLLKEPDLEARVEGLCRRAGLPIRLPEHPNVEQLMEPLRKDKKVRDGRVRFVLPRVMGKVEIVSGIEERDVVAAMKEVTQA